jgi:hypothetical protein
VAGAGGTRRSSHFDEVYAPFVARPLCTYRAHTAAVLDLAWSKVFGIWGNLENIYLRLELLFVVVVDGQNRPFVARVA